ncbi:MAG: metallophosphoesterase [Clostridia bacterium]|nr:metallophosphoesterase [Clostridia bacterium]
MSLFVIGDLHLHFQSELKARGQLIAPVWKNHEERFLNNCRRMVGPRDTLVLAGDHSWGRNMDECARDFEYILSLPGRKILLRGNHDMFWDAKKTAALNERFAGRLFFLQNNYASYNDYALVGTKGFTFEGPFYLDRRGRVVGWDEEEEARARKLVEREAERLRVSFEAARKDGYRKFIMFLHYPPTNMLEKDSAFTRMAEEYGAEHVIYAHCHGQSRFHDSVMGMKNGVRYSLASGDFLEWVPLRVKDR